MVSVGSSVGVEDGHGVAAVVGGDRGRRHGDGGVGTARDQLDRADAAVAETAGVTVEADGDAEAGGRRGVVGDDGDRDDLTVEPGVGAVGRQRRRVADGDLVDVVDADRRVRLVAAGALDDDRVGCGTGVDGCADVDVDGSDRAADRADDGRLGDRLFGDLELNGRRVDGRLVGGDVLVGRRPAADSAGAESASADAAARTAGASSAGRATVAAGLRPAGCGVAGLVPARDRRARRRRGRFAGRGRGGGPAVGVVGSLPVGLVVLGAVVSVVGGTVVGVVGVVVVGVVVVGSVAGGPSVVDGSLDGAVVVGAALVGVVVDVVVVVGSVAGGAAAVDRVAGRRRLGGGLQRRGLDLEVLGVRGELEQVAGGVGGERGQDPLAPPPAIDEGSSPFSAVARTSSAVARSSWR